MKRKVYAYCERCDTPIYDGEEYAYFDDRHYCLDCIDEVFEEFKADVIETADCSEPAEERY